MKRRALVAAVLLPAVLGGSFVGWRTLRGRAGVPEATPILVCVNGKPPMTQIIYNGRSCAEGSRTLGRWLRGGGERPVTSVDLMGPFADADAAVLREAPGLERLNLQG